MLIVQIIDVIEKFYELNQIFPLTSYNQSFTSSTSYRVDDKSFVIIKLHIVE